MQVAAGKIALWIKFRVARSKNGRVFLWKKGIFNEFKK